MAAVANPPSAQLVGNAFVQQYYHILHNQPGNAYRFYQDISKLGRPKEDGSMTITTTLQAIEEKIVTLNYSDFRAEIKSADAQDSFNGGVEVLVTGYLTGRNNVVRNFTQVFFLAPQDGGYFVLNDIFRYMDSVNDVVPPVVEETLADDREKKKKKGGAEDNDGQLEALSSNDLRNIESGESEALRGTRKSKLESEVLESLFQPESSVHEPTFSDMVKKLTSLSPNDEGDDMEQQHPDSIKSYHHKGRIRSKSDREDERTSLKTFADKNMSMHNTITFDLHGQNVNQATKLLKIHLLFGAFVRSVRTFKVITGRGKHSADGNPKLKNWVIGFLKKAGMTWWEQKGNPGMLCIDLQEQTDFSFLYSGSGSDTE